MRYLTVTGVQTCALPILQSGWPTPTADVAWRNRTIGDAFVFGVTAPYQIVQDYRLAAGDPLTDLDVRERRLVAVLRVDRGEKVFDDAPPGLGPPGRGGGWAVPHQGGVAEKGARAGPAW